MGKSGNNRGCVRARKHHTRGYDMGEKSTEKGEYMQAGRIVTAIAKPAVMLLVTGRGPVQTVMPKILRRTRMQTPGTPPMAQTTIVARL